MFCTKLVFQIIFAGFFSSEAHKTRMYHLLSSLITGIFNQRGKHCFVWSCLSLQEQLVYTKTQSTKIQAKDNPGALQLGREQVLG
jgi:hypothetical protein